MIAKKVQKLSKLGLVCIPCNGKKPSILEWQKLKETPIDSFNKETMSYGIVCGKNSGITVIDIDDYDCWLSFLEKIELKEWFEKNEQLIPTTISPSGGRHYYFNYDSDVKTGSNVIKINGHKMIDIRNDASQVIAPGSVYNTNKEEKKQFNGKKYKSELFFDDLDDDEKLLDFPKKIKDIILSKKEFTFDEPLVLAEPTKEPTSSATKEPPQESKRESIKTNDIILDTNQSDEEIFDLLLTKFKEFHPDSADSRITPKGDYYYIEFKKSTNNECCFAKRCHKSNHNFITYHPRERIAYYKCHDDDCNTKKLKIFGKPNNKKMKEYTQLNTFDPDYNYSYNDFLNDYRGHVFDSIEELDETILPILKKIIARTSAGNSFYIKKDRSEGSFIFESFSKWTDNTNITMHYNKIKQVKKEDTLVKKDITLQNYVNNKLMTFENVVSKLDHSTVHPRDFNIAGDFLCKLVDEKTYEDNKEKLTTMTNFIKDVICDNNDELYKWVISWIYGLVDKTNPKNKTALVMISEEQGLGKNTLIEFMQDYLLGKNFVSVKSDIPSITKSFNKFLIGKRLVSCNELSSTRDEFKANFNNLKEKITETRIDIEPKGYDPYNVDLLAGFIFASQWIDSMYIERSDRRYTCIELVKQFDNKKEYFTKLRKECFNQTMGNVFYTYLTKFEKVDITVPVMTPLKEKMIKLSLASHQKFINQLIEDRDYEETKGDDQYADSDLSCIQLMLKHDTEEVENSRKIIRASKLYRCYTDWCSENGEGKISQTKFGVYLDKVEKKRTKVGFNYYLDSFKKY